MSKMIGGIETEKDYPEGGADTLGTDGTIAQKAAFACSSGLAGMMAWRLDSLVLSFLALDTFCVLKCN